MRRIIAALLMMFFLFPAAFAQAEDGEEDVVVHEVELEEESPEEAAEGEPEAAPEKNEPAGDFLLGVEPEPSEITPAYRSQEHPDHGEGCFWCTPMNLEDEDAIWKMLTSPITVVQAKDKEKALDDQMRQTVIYAEPDEKSEKIGMVTGQSQGVHVLETRDDGWSKVETYSTSFHDSKVKNWNGFVTGWIQTKKLITDTKVNQHYGIIIDKLTQRLYLFVDGHLETELAVSTGKYNEKQPYNETRSGDFLIISVTVGRIKSDNLICDYALRYNAADYLHEVPHLKNGDGSKNFKSGEAKLGVRASHGCIRAQRLTNAEGYKMSSIYKLIQETTKETKKNVRLVIWEDYAGRQIEIPGDDTLVYYNPKGGVNYHKCAECNGVKDKFLPLTAFPYSELETDAYKKLTPCAYCMPAPRRAELEAVNEEHLHSSPGDIMTFWPEED